MLSETSKHIIAGMDRRFNARKKGFKNCGSFVDQKSFMILIDVL